jgi:two-component system OmpR family sensor kinase
MNIISGRLFWKILLGFWFTFIVICQILWLVFTFYNPHEPPESGIARHFVHRLLDNAAASLRSGGLPALDTLLATWPQEDRDLLSVLPVTRLDAANIPGRALFAFPAQGSPADAPPDGPPPGPPPDGARGEPPDGRPDGPPDGGEDVPHNFRAGIVEYVKGSDGEAYELRYNVDALMFRYGPQHQHSSHFLNMPPILLWIGGFGGLLFSGVLAWNLTRPMSQMRKAFGCVAQGDLSVRLFANMSKRHDELSDVARDFDSMVERLQVLVSAREELLHDVSHELRSPLARLQLAIGLARQNPSNVEISLQRIEHEAGRLDKMIGELLVLSRTESGVIPDEEYFDLYGLVEAVVNDACYEAQLPGVKIELQVADAHQDYTVKGNAELMRRAIDNVVRNALRFSTRGQTVNVRLICTEPYLSLEVVDQGPGVEEDKLSSIFDPFVRVKSPLSGKGYGLGLAITRKVVMAHDGKVEAFNGENEGLVIKLQVPHWRVS